MKFGFVKSAVCSQKICVADVDKNVDAIKDAIDSAKESGVEVLCFPYLSLTGATCGDLFFTKTLQDGVVRGVKEIKEYSEGIKTLIAVSFPFKLYGKLYLTTALIFDGKVLGLVPKSILSDRFGIDEKRYFTAYDGENTIVNFLGDDTLFGLDILFKDTANSSLVVAVADGSEVVNPFSMTKDYAALGATVILSPSVSQITVGSNEKLRADLESLTRTLGISVLSAFSSRGESTSEAVYGGVCSIVECGKTLAESKLFEEGLTVAEIDTEKLLFKREKELLQSRFCAETVCFSASTDTDVSRLYPKYPFVPGEREVCNERADFILRLQTEALAKRLEATRAETLIVGLSGGLDSTLAILAAVEAVKRVGKTSKDVIAVTMPCFGTTERTLDNSVKLAKALSVTLKKVDITKAVVRHLKDISHDLSIKDVAYENAQARERTQVLMDVSNMTGGLVVGTGDLSEVALGWSTYNGDHMSMYGVNCSIPKTLVRCVVQRKAELSKGKLKAVLFDILDTPVSPELLPPEEGEIAQKTEDIVGPYALHDFFLYGMMKHGFTPKKIYALACIAFKDDYDDETILKWLKIFVKRFFTQQFKRSCVPDGVKVGTVALSPRGEYMVPSDASYGLWMKELEEL